MGNGHAIFPIILQWHEVEMNRASNVAIVLMVVLALLGCGYDCLKPKTEEVRSLLEKELKVGDIPERVEEVLKNAGISYSYDPFQNRYQSRIADSRCGPYQAITVYVYLDSLKKMSKFEVRVTFTGP